MRHNKKINHLGRKSAHRNAMLSNMSTSLIMHKRIFTTVAKAKALRKVVEPIITKSKEDTTHSRRLAFEVLQSKNAVTELFQNISQKVADRPGGYTRIIKTGNRLGDNASMCFIELVDYNENMLKDKKAASKGRTRRSKKSADATADVAEKAPKATAKKAAAKEEVAPEVAAPEAVVEEVATPEVETAPVAEATVETPEVETPATEAPKKEEE